MSTLVVPFSLIAYAAVLIWLAATDARRADHYMTARRSVGTFATMASVAGNLRDGAGLAAWVVLGIFYGFGALWLTLGLCAGLAIIALFAPRVRAAAEARDYLTVQQLFRDELGSRFARLSSWIVAGTALLYAAAQVNIAGNLFSRAIGSAPWIGIASTCAIVAAYLYFGGYYTTIRSGIVQWCIIMVIVVIPWLIQKADNISIPLATWSSPGLLTGTAFFGISMVVVLSSADLWQLVFTSRTSRTARAGMLLTIPVYLVISIGLVYFAKSVQATLPDGTNPDAALFELFSAGVLPAAVTTVVALFIVAAIMSTLDSQVFLFASTVVEERLPEGTSTDDPRMRRALRQVLLLTFIALGIIAMSIGNIVEFLFSAVTLGTVLVPPILIAAFRLGRSSSQRPNVDLGILLSVGISAVIYAVLFVAGAFKNLALTLVPVLISGLGCAITMAVQTLGRREDTKTDTKRVKTG